MNSKTKIGTPIGWQGFGLSVLLQLSVIAIIFLLTSDWFNIEPVACGEYEVIGSATVAIDRDGILNGIIFIVATVATVALGFYSREMELMLR